MRAQAVVVASIIIPTYNHAARLTDAIESALAQTVPCEVIVIDDGSTDGTAMVLDRFKERVRAVTLPHGGPSVARNTGLELARGEFVMFLDADDVIAPTKVADQLAEFTDEIGWVLCDVEIQDEARRESVLASHRYRYADKSLGGWIRDELTRGPFIPIMSPLVRRSALAGIRFDDRLVPEDYHFWCKVASVARVRYVPKVLATYRKSRDGRSRRPKTSRSYSPNLTMPRRLNLGCGTPGTRSWHPIDGMENLDKSLGWTFEDGLGDFIESSVAGITISHSLMYVPIDKWPFVFSEFARVLAPGGIVRITEDDAINPASRSVGGWKGSEPAVTLTSAQLVLEHLARAGLHGYEVTSETTRFSDRSLCQAQHGETPHVFFVEGVRPSAVLFAPHSDDETLFAAFTILKHRPHVVVCFESAGDYGETKVREAETRDAMSVLGAAGVEQWAGGELETQMRDLDARLRPSIVFAPSERSSHPDHVHVARAAAAVFGSRLTQYHTYINGKKVTSDRVAPFERPWIAQKLRALARYESQIAHPRAHEFFLCDLREYLD